MVSGHGVPALHQDPPTNQSINPTPHTRVSTSNALAAHLWPILSELMGEETGWLGGDSRVEGKDRCVVISTAGGAVVCQPNCVWRV